MVQLRPLRVAEARGQYHSSNDVILESCNCWDLDSKASSEALGPAKYSVVEVESSSGLESCSTTDLAALELAMIDRLVGTKVEGRIWGESGEFAR